MDRRLGTEADVSMILDERPGSSCRLHGGLPHTGQTPEWGRGRGSGGVGLGHPESGKVAPKGNVLVYDAISAHAGSGVADFIASRAICREMVTPDVKIADDTGGTTFPIIYRCSAPRA